MYRKVIPLGLHEKAGKPVRNRWNADTQPTRLSLSPGKYHKCERSCASTVQKAETRAGSPDPSHPAPDSLAFSCHPRIRCNSRSPKQNRNPLHSETKLNRDQGLARQLFQAGTRVDDILAIVAKHRHIFHFRIPALSAHMHDHDPPQPHPQHTTSAVAGMPVGLG